MGDCLSRAALAPVTYIKGLRGIKIDDVSMKGTSMYPAFPITVIASLLSMLAFATYMIIYFFTEDSEESCYAHITYGIIALSIIYPIEAIIIWIGLVGSVALGAGTCWKYFISMFLGTLVAGFSFGGLGFVYLCTINEVSPIIIPATFLSSNTFIQVICYTYLSFFGLYLILIPLLTCSYSNRNSEGEGGCSDNCCCVFFYFFNILSILTAIFMIAIKLIGPPLLIYVLIEEVRSGLYTSSPIHRPFFALALLAICLPPATFLFIKIVKMIGCSFSGSEEQEETNEVEM